MRVCGIIVYSTVRPYRRTVGSESLDVNVRGARPSVNPGDDKVSVGGDSHTRVVLFRYRVVIIDKEVRFIGADAAGEKATQQHRSGKQQ